MTRAEKSLTPDVSKFRTEWRCEEPADEYVVLRESWSEDLQTRYIWEVAPPVRDDSLERIVRDLAACEPPVDREMGDCGLCEGWYWREGTYHYPTCEWARAQAWVAANPETR